MVFRVLHFIFSLAGMKVLPVWVLLLSGMFAILHWHCTEFNIPYSEFTLDTPSIYKGMAMFWFCLCILIMFPVGIVFRNKYGPPLRYAAFGGFSLFWSGIVWFLGYQIAGDAQFPWWLLLILMGTCHVLYQMFEWYDELYLMLCKRSGRPPMDICLLAWHLM